MSERKLAYKSKLMNSTPQVRLSSSPPYSSLSSLFSKANININLNINLKNKTYPIRGVTDIAVV